MMPQSTISAIFGLFTSRQSDMGTSAERREVLTMRNYVRIDTQRVINAFDRECKECFFTAYMPEEVEAAKKKLEEAIVNGPVKMERLKERLIHDLVNLFDEKGYYDMDSYDLAPYDANGDKIVA